MKFLTVVVVALLVGCAGSPDKPMSLEEQQVMQATQFVNNADLYVHAFSTYVSLKCDEWDEQKCEDYLALAERGTAAVALARDLLAENNLSSVETQKLIIDALLEEMERRQKPEE